ncbi:uncharacterized protein BKA78DRAFT_89433 [Phyllosticta capitalensis]|uniref:uncharacterized protein n=1 Tax=Phyllosticta capitalensis TaxID=121624 RepID=UPI00313249D9
MSNSNGGPVHLKSSLFHKRQHPPPISTDQQRHPNRPLQKCANCIWGTSAGDVGYIQLFDLSLVFSSWPTLPLQNSSITSPQIYHGTSHHFRLSKPSTVGPGMMIKRPQHRFSSHCQSCGQRAADKVASCSGKVPQVGQEIVDLKLQCTVLSAVFQSDNCAAFCRAG